MGNFQESYKITVLGNEGGYNAGVNEAETYRGIDRSMNPHWSGWAVIDSLKPFKSDQSANLLLNQNKDLQADIINFYLNGYWNPLQLSRVTDQQVCNILFDDSVNPCEISAAKVMQTACGACGVPISVDGQIGDKTIQAVSSIVPKTYYNAIVAIRTFHYNNEVVKNPKQRIWLKNWLSRLVPYNDHYGV
jgi:lysozyme family protein